MSDSEFPEINSNVFFGAGIHLHEMFTGFCSSGFTVEQAMQLVVAYLQAQIAKS